MLPFSNPATMFKGVGLVSPAALRPYINKNGQSVIAIDGREITTNAVASLRYDEWKDIDRRVIAVATQRLVGVGDLISRGLVHNLGSIGNTIAQWQRSSDITPAQVNMSGVSRGEKDTMNFDTKAVPVPVVFKDFEVNLRRLAASRLMGEALDTSMSDMAARVVAEASEDMLFAGRAIQVDGETIYGYTNHPDRNTASLAKQWTASNCTGAEILAMVQAMLVLLRADLMFGPYTLYIPGGYETRLDDDFAPGTSDARTIRQRIMQLEGISAIRVADRLAAHNVILVQLERNTVDMAIAQDITTVQWQTMGMLQENYKVMAVWAPRVKSDFDGRSGLCHMS